MNKEIVLNFSISESLVNIFKENACSLNIDLNTYIEKIVKDKLLEEIKNNESFNKKIIFYNELNVKM